MAINKIFISTLAIVAAISCTYGDTTQKKITAFIGSDAYTFQEETGFPVGYPTSQNELTPTGGRMRNVEAHINLGPIGISCRNAYLALYRLADLISSGEVYCPLENSSDEIANLSTSLSSSREWDRYENFMLSPRRSATFGNNLESAFRYLEEASLQGVVLRVPLYSWLDDDGIYIEIDVTRASSIGDRLSYEVKFSWGASCLLDVEANGRSKQKSDEQRAAQNRRRLPEICRNIPAIFLPPQSA